MGNCEHQRSRAEDDDEVTCGLAEDIFRKHQVKGLLRSCGRAQVRMAEDDEAEQALSKKGSRTRSVRFSAAGKPKQPCKYGANCYRRSPEHLALFTHPGEEDYGKPRRRPCRYGASCFRKNPEHLAAFSHPGDADYNADGDAGKPKKKLNPKVSKKAHGKLIEVDKLGELALFRSQAEGFITRFELGKRLNAGAQGVTYLATERASGRTVVVKQPNDVEDTGDFDLLVHKTHPNIVRVFELFHNPMETYIVMECCSGGDLFKAVETLGTPTQNWCAAIMKQACRGVKYLHHEFQQSHNDIKPENILLDHKPVNSGDIPRVMIGDFGCATGSGATRSSLGGGGDPRYRAPETFADYAFGFESDVWSLGVTLFEVLTGGLLIYVNYRNISGWGAFCEYDGGQLAQAFMTQVQSFQPVRLDNVPGDLPRSLLEGMLEVGLYDRMSLDDVLQHPWLALDKSSEIIKFRDEEAVRLLERARGSKLRAGLLNLVGTTLAGESIRYYRDIWSQYDTDASGSMEFEEFESMIADMGLVGPVDPKLRRLPLAHLLPVPQLPSAEEMFRIADCSGNGVVSFSEFVGIMFNADELDATEKTEYFRSAFQRLAGDNDAISAAEFAGLFPDVDAAIIHQLFAEIDQDHNGAIEFVEFSSYIDTL